MKERKTIDTCWSGFRRAHSLVHKSNLVIRVVFGLESTTVPGTIL